MVRRKTPKTNQPQGGQKKRFKDGVKTSMKALEIEPGKLEHLAKDRDHWRAAIRQGADLHEKRRTETAVNRRGLRKGTTIPPSVATIPCPHCPRLFRAQIGLTGHLRTRRPRPPR